MRKRYLIGAVVLALAAVLVVGVATSGAWFTAQDTQAGNTIGAGKLAVDIRAESGTTLPMVLSNMQPGEWKPIPEFALGMYNLNSPASTLPCKYRISFANVVPTGAANLNNVLTVRVRHTFAGTPGTWPVVYEGPFDSFLFRSTLDGAIGGGILNPNITHVFKFEFKIAESAGNEYQGTSVAFNVVLDAFQVNDPVF